MTKETGKAAATSRSRQGACAAIALAMAFTTTSLAPVFAQDLPIRRMVIYKNGVAYVERGGDVSGHKTVTLSFRAEEMTDILKSMSVGAEGGAVERVRFSTDESLDAKLAPFPFRLNDGQNMSALLDALKGSKLEARHGPDAVSGTIIAARKIDAAGDTPAKEVVTLLEADGAMTTYDIASLNKLKLEDPKIQQQLTDYLRIVAESRNQNRRSVSFDLKGNGAKQLSARYMTPMPVWKSSYRLIFPDTGKPVLEGWAIVDNTSGEDWKGVSLALVSGKPVSFVTNIYPPVNVDRPFVELPGIESVAPVVYERAMSSGGFVGAQGGRALAAPKMMPSELAAHRDEPPPPPPAPSAISSTATGKETGAMFSYQFPGAVDVRKSESVMLPFLQTPVTAAKLMVFSEGQDVADHPMLALELQNDSGVVLDGGPITVFDGGEYAGDSLFETTSKGEKRLLSYGVDLGTSIRVESTPRAQRVQELKMSKGMLEIRSRMRVTTKYIADNADPKAKQLLIERILRQGYAPVSPKPTATTATMNRYALDLPANGANSLEIVEEYPGSQFVRVSDSMPSQLEIYLENPSLSAAAKAGLQRIVAKQREISGNTNAATASNSRIETLNRSMDRVRNNMESLNRVTGQEAQVQRLATELGTLQSQVAAEEATLDKLRTAGQALREELAALIASIEF